MENRFTSEEKPNYYKRRLAILLTGAIFFLMLGRQLTFLPTINLSMNTNEEDLQKKIERLIESKGGSYSIYYKNLDNEKEFGINTNQINTGASVNKVPIVASLYLLAKEDKISLDERVTIQKEDVQDYGTGSIRYQKMPQAYSLRNLAKLAMKQSDNTAAHVIELKIGEENVQKLVDNWGMKQTNMVENKTSVFDMSILFEKIYRGEITDEANTKELLEFMSNTDFEDRLSTKLPKTATVYHKTGDEEGYLHDLGLVKTEKGTYYLGIMTSDIGGKEDDTKKTISEISKIIFDSISN